jgi:hypothetical protein
MTAAPAPTPESGAQSHRPQLFRSHLVPESSTLGHDQLPLIYPQEKAIDWGVHFALRIGEDDVNGDGRRDPKLERLIEQSLYRDNVAGMNRVQDQVGVRVVEERRRDRCQLSGLGVDAYPRRRAQCPEVGVRRPTGWAPVLGFPHIRRRNVRILDVAERLILGLIGRTVVPSPLGIGGIGV